MNDTIRLYQFPPAWGLPSASPFCIKLETWLRMAGLTYEVMPEASMDAAPKGKLPYIEHKGRPIGDSGLIVSHLEKSTGRSLDGGLNPAQRAIGHALRRMLEEHLYWAMTYARWMEETNAAITKQALFGALPPEVADAVFLQVKETVRQQLHQHGIGRHAKEEIYELGIADLAALSDFLADKPFFMGNDPATLDASAYGFLASLLAPPIESPLKTAAEKHHNLVSYCERMRQRYF